MQHMLIDYSIGLPELSIPMFKMPLRRFTFSRISPYFGTLMLCSGAFLQSNGWWGYVHRNILMLLEHAQLLRCSLKLIAWVGWPNKSQIQTLSDSNWVWNTLVLISQKIILKLKFLRTVCVNQSELWNVDLKQVMQVIYKSDPVSGMYIKGRFFFFSEFHSMYVWHPDSNASPTVW